MTVQEKLSKLQELALADERIRKELLATKSESDPLLAFCNKCKELGFDIQLGELVGSGQDFCDAMLRSVNGGGVEKPTGGWDDSYELFMSAIEI